MLFHEMHSYQRASEGSRILWKSYEPDLTAQCLAQGECDQSDVALITLWHPMSSS